MSGLKRGNRYRITYRNAQGEPSQREIQVLSVTAGPYGRTYIRAFCRLAGEERTFRLDRVGAIVPLDGASRVTQVTHAHNSRYDSAYRASLGCGSESDSERSPVLRDTPCASRRQKSHGLGRFMLKAAALFLLFDFVISSDPGGMSRGMLSQMELLIDPNPGLRPPEPVPAPEPAPLPQPSPLPSPEPRPRPAGAEETSAEGLHLSAKRPGRMIRHQGSEERGVREARLAQLTGVTDELVISRFDRADTDRNGKLSWGELRRFQAEVYRDFRYENNARALRPREFFVAGGGDCEDFAIFSAAMLTYWGWEAYVASLSTNPNDAHAVVFVRVDQPPSWASYYEVTAGPEDPRFETSGIFVPVDYDIVGGLSNAVTPGSKVTDIVVPREWYGLAI